MIDDERLFAWLDGELRGDEEAEVAAAVAASPELSARAEQHRQLGSGLRRAFDPVLNAGAAPPAFESAKVIEFGARATGRERRRSWPAATQWAAMAASLAVGVLAGAQLAGPPVSPVAVDDGRLIAASGLDRTLDLQLASAPTAEGARIGLTFRDAAGRICRSFTDAEVSGLACREGQSWQMRGLFPAAEGQGGDYRMAAGEHPGLSALVDQTIRGEPFDAVQERAALERGWR